MDTRDRVALRIKEASEKDLLAGSFFLAAFERVGSLAGAERAEALAREVVGDQELSPHFKYPVAWFLTFAHRAAVLPGVTAELSDFMRGLGNAMVQRSENSAISKAMTLRSKGDPHVFLSATTTAHQTLTTFGHREHERTGDRTAVMRYRNEYLGAAFVTGMLEQAMQQIFNVKLTTTPTLENKSGSTYSLACAW